MKPRILLMSAPLFVAGLMTACSVKVKSDSDKPTQSIDAVADVNLQGKLFGKPWELGVGRIEGNDFDSSLNITMISGKKENVCEDFMLKGDDNMAVSFFIEEEDLKEEKYELGIESGRTVTFVESTDAETKNQVVLNGSYEFTEISAGKVIGKMVAADSDENVVNGNFEVVRCCKDDSTGGSKVCGTGDGNVEGTQQQQEEQEEQQQQQQPLPDETFTLPYSFWLEQSQNDDDGFCLTDIIEKPHTMTVTLHDNGDKMAGTFETMADYYRDPIPRGFAHSKLVANFTKDKTSGMYEANLEFYRIFKGETALYHSVKKSVSDISQLSVNTAKELNDRKFCHTNLIFATPPMD